MQTNAQPLLEQIARQLETRCNERNIADPLVIGIHTGGVWVAERIHERLAATKLVQDPLGTLDISFYRDDFTRIGLNPKVKPSNLPVMTEGRHVILVDDVLMSGRTIRAALNVLFEFGRPASVTLVVLVDLNANELPIKADIVGQTLDLPANQRIKLSGPDNLALSIKTLEPEADTI